MAKHDGHCQPMLELGHLPKELSWLEFSGEKHAGHAFGANQGAIGCLAM